MGRIVLKSESALIEKIVHSDHYKAVRERHFAHKAAREAEAWKMLQEYRGKYAPEILRAIFGKVDTQPQGGRWFGCMLAMPNQNLIFQSAPQHLNQWLDELLFSDHAVETRLRHCMKDMKVKGASKGLATLLLYLSDPMQYSVWVNATEEGLVVLGRIGELTGKDWGGNYQKFNNAAIAFRDAHKIEAREVDWFLSYIRTYVESDGQHLSLDEDGLGAAPETVIVDDEEDAVDDIVGEPMELGVMRWTPVNEMGVVALFIGFRKELGFPIVEIIRTRFPDAAVFEETAKGRYVRRYVEFEFRSSGYKSHLKSKRKCHYVICWEHDWKDCPLPVIELSSRVPDILSKGN